METVTIGRCGDCVSRHVRKDEKSGFCVNKHIMESGGCDYRYIWESDCLVYSYDEGGAFEVGENFGCVHWEFKE